MTKGGSPKTVPTSWADRLGSRPSPPALAFYMDTLSFYLTSYISAYDAAIFPLPGEPVGFSSLSIDSCRPAFHRLPVLVHERLGVLDDHHPFERAPEALRV